MDDCLKERWRPGILRKMLVSSISVAENKQVMKEHKAIEDSL